MTGSGAPPRAEKVPRLHLVTDDRVLAFPDFLERAGRVVEAAGRRGPGRAGASGGGIGGGAIADGARGTPGREDFRRGTSSAIAERVTPAAALTGVTPAALTGVSPSAPVTGVNPAAPLTVATFVPRMALHLRGPRTPARRLWEFGSALLPLCREAGVSFLVNDRIDLALALGADGVHLGGRSLPPRVARTLLADRTLPAERTLLADRTLLGASVHGEAEAGEMLVGAAAAGHADSAPARSVPLDYLLAGSLYPTRSHPDRAPIGIEGLRQIIALAQGLPVLAIGGIDRERSAEAMAAGAAGVAIVGGVWNAPDPVAAVLGMLDRIGEFLQTSAGG